MIQREWMSHCPGWTRTQCGNEIIRYNSTWARRNVNVFNWPLLRCHFDRAASVIALCDLGQDNELSRTRQLFTGFFFSKIQQGWTFWQAPSEGFLQYDATIRLCYTFCIKPILGSSIRSALAIILLQSRIFLYRFICNRNFDDINSSRTFVWFWKLGIVDKLIIFNRL